MMTEALVWESPDGWRVRANDSPAQGPFPTLEEAKWYLPLGQYRVVPLPRPAETKRETAGQLSWRSRIRQWGGLSATFIALLSLAACTPGEEPVNHEMLAAERQTQVVLSGISSTLCDPPPGTIKIEKTTLDGGGVMTVQRAPDMEAMAARARTDWPKDQEYLEQFRLELARHAHPDVEHVTRVMRDYEKVVAAADSSDFEAHLSHLCFSVDWAEKRLSD